MTTAHEFIKKGVLDSKANEVGIIADIDFDLESWSLTTIRVKVPAKTCKELGLSGLVPKSKTAIIPPDLVENVGDRMILKVTLQELIEQVELE